MNSLKNLPIIFIVILLSGCSSTENSKLIVGNWHAISWLVNGIPSNLNVRSTAFSFNDKGGYSYEYSGTKETGTYKVENDMLFTTPANQQEMMVKITKLTPDSLIFDMNRSGQPETLTLLRK